MQGLTQVDESDVEVQTSNGRLSRTDLESTVVLCENDRETISFKLLPQRSDQRLINILAYLNEKVNALNAKFDADEKPRIPFMTKDGEETWYHLHRV